MLSDNIVRSVKIVAWGIWIITILFHVNGVSLKWLSTFMSFGLERSIELERLFFWSRF